jgi:serine/threonine-protein kinase
MEYLEGEDLSAWVRRRGPLSVELAVELLLQACEAIAEAHGLGIVHRDLKPANLFCIRKADGLLSIKVLDFGISKLTGATGSIMPMSMTASSATIGSPLYMSPEQMQSARSVDARTDIWSLGVVLFELLTGTVPFTGETLPEVAIRVATYPMPSLSALRPGVPAGIAAAIAKCLQKDRTGRFANVAALAIALAPFGPKRCEGSLDCILRVTRGAGRATKELAPPSSDGEIRPSPTGTLSTWGRTGSKGGRSGTQALAVIIAGVFIAGAVLWLARGKAAPSPSDELSRVEIRTNTGAPGPAESPSDSVAALPRTNASAGVSSTAAGSASVPVVPGARDAPERNGPAGVAPYKPNPYVSIRPEAAKRSPPASSNVRSPPIAPTTIAPAPPPAAASDSVILDALGGRL